MAANDKGHGRTHKAHAAGNYHFTWEPIPEDPGHERVQRVEITRGAGADRMVLEKWERQPDGMFQLAGGTHRPTTGEPLAFHPGADFTTRASAWSERKANAMGGRGTMVYGKEAVEDHLWAKGYEYGKARDRATGIALDQAANLDAGDFISELATVMTTQYRSGLREGDYLEDVERYTTDGCVFGEESRRAGAVKLRVAVALDRSRSMYANGIMGTAGRALIALDKTVRQAQQELPEGSLAYQPFVFAGEAERRRDLNLFTGQYMYPSSDWDDTNIAPLLESIEKWEQEDGADPDAFKLDLIITDGVLEHPRDVARANQIQARRNGRGATIMLNFLPREEWGDYHLPARCFQYPVTKDSLAAQLRAIVTEVVGMLA